MKRWPARWRCHGNLWCCQYVDQPMCNSWNDPHLLARWHYRRQRRREHDTGAMHQRARQR